MVFIEKECVKWDTTTRFFWFFCFERTCRDLYYWVIFYIFKLYITTFHTYSVSFTEWIRIMNIFTMIFFFTAGHILACISPDDKWWSVLSSRWKRASPVVFNHRANGYSPMPLATSVWIFHLDCYFKFQLVPTKNCWTIINFLPFI